MNIRRYFLLCIGLFSLALTAFNQQAIKPLIESESGDFNSPDFNYGVVLTAPDGSAYRITVANGGTIVTTNQSSMSAVLEAQSGDYYSADSRYGLILAAPDGTTYRIKVANDGAVVTEDHETLDPLVELETGDFYGQDYRYGIVLRSPNNSCYRIRVENGGAVMTENVTCPIQCIDEELNLETDALGAQDQNISHGNFTGVPGWEPAKEGDNSSTKIIIKSSDIYSAGEIYPLTTTETRAKVSYMFMLEDDWMPLDGLILPGLSAIDNGTTNGGLADGGAGYGDGDSSMPANQQKSWSARGFTRPMPYTDRQIIRDNHFNIRDKIAAGPPYVARLIERHPEWDHHLDPASSYDGPAVLESTSIKKSIIEECEVFLDCVSFVIGDDCN